VSKVGRNLVFLLVSQVATWSITLVVLVIAPDKLGPDGFGQFGFATTFVQYFTLAASLGTATLLIKVVARDASQLGIYVYNALLLKLVLVSVLSGVAILGAWLIDTRGDALALIAIGCIGMLLITLNEVLVGAQAGLEVMGKPALWGVAQTYAASGVGLLILFLGGNVVPFGWAFALAPVVPLVANARKVLPWIGESRRFDPTIWKALVWGGVPLMILTSLNLIYGTIDIPILRNMAGDTEVGWYTLAYRFVAIPVFISTAAVTAFFPSFSARAASSAAEFTRQVNRALRLVVTVSVPAAAGIAVVSEDLIQMFYDDRFDDAISVMQILALHIPLAATGVILGMALVASDRQNLYIFVALTAAVAAPLIAVVFIRWAMDEFDNGAIGASISTFIVEIIVTSGALLMRTKGVMDGKTTWLCVRVLAAGAAMAGIVAVADGAVLLLRIAIGLVAYTSASLALRTVTIADARRVLDTLTGTVGSIRNRAAPGAAE
jgi:O-antigen/teichoic acid export membrane protein